MIVWRDDGLFNCIYLRKSNFGIKFFLFNFFLCKNASPKDEYVGAQ